jgi:hypothetical protein
MGREGEELQAKVIENMFSKIIAEKFPNPEKERYKRLSKYQIDKIRKETPLTIL